ncbi:MAG: uracil-DNA glycosylase [Treponema sp.]|nr:uracil-DNA glycosylase [Treponema sp.]
MTKSEKEIIYNLLKSADANINGYRRDKFANPPEFFDDQEKPNNKVEIANQAENIQKPEENKNITQEINVPRVEISEGGLKLKDLNEKIIRCTRCGLARTRTNVVPGQGVENPKVLVIGEGPGYEEDQKGLPFVGKAGHLLDKMLAAIDLSREKNCYIANIVKCRPPENRDPFPDEQAACMSFLEAQIHILKPKMILCMGRIAGNKLLNLEKTMNELHGQFFDFNGIPLMVTYHPSALLRNEELKVPAWHDLKKFKKALEEMQ